MLDVEKPTRHGEISSVWKGRDLYIKGVGPANELTESPGNGGMGDRMYSRRAIRYNKRESALPKDAMAAS